MWWFVEIIHVKVRCEAFPSSFLNKLTEIITELLTLYMHSVYEQQ